eukprot:COSAG01_NODE_11612_length_1894_cov_10.087465_3_plen_92_part_00
MSHLFLSRNIEDGNAWTGVHGCGGGGTAGGAHGHLDAALGLAWGALARPPQLPHTPWAPSPTLDRQRLPGGCAPRLTGCPDVLEMISVVID